MMEASNSRSPWGTWQLAHTASVCGPAGWFSPVVKLTSSWQEPHAAELGRVYQMLASAAVGSWQVAQLRMSCGNTTVEKSTTDWPNPMIWYGLPAFTLGRFSPRWILWSITLKSTVLPVSGSVV